jgi:hypothetical protein
MTSKLNNNDIKIEDIKDVVIPEIIMKVKNMLETEFFCFVENINELKQSLIEEKNKNKELNSQITQLELKNKELGDKLKSKANSAIWEKSILLIQEKDKQIELIKKDLDFYKRNYNIKTFEGKTIFENLSSKNETKIEKIQVKEQVKEKVKEEIVEEVKEQVKEEIVEEVKLKKKKKTKKPIQVDDTTLEDLEKELLI